MTNNTPMLTNFSGMGGVNYNAMNNNSNNNTNNRGFGNFQWF